jgi:hypothetical protein
LNPRKRDTFLAEENGTTYRSLPHLRPIHPIERFSTSPHAVDKDDFAVFSNIESNQTGKEEWVSEAPQLVKKIHDDAKECLVLAMEMSYCSFRDAGRKCFQTQWIRLCQIFSWELQPEKVQYDARITATSTRYE